MSKLLTTDEASEYLGISKLTLYGWVSARKLEFVNVGRPVEFKQDYYVEFRVIDSEDRKSLVLASGVPGARKKTLEGRMS